MSCLRRCVLSTLVVAVCCIAPGSGAPKQTIAAPTEGGDAQASSIAIHALRIRKLHLVRPDLINYPLVQDVIC